MNIYSKENVYKRGEGKSLFSTGMKSAMKSGRKTNNRMTIGCKFGLAQEDPLKIQVGFNPEVPSMKR